ncbi:hypothetical protein IPZ58_28955 [Streptomyces roseoverticillatus]|uniref:hypothetical protein n=1 Tax=Streptomyces roseoverticillatus TaxID=66429 RepID=UPI001F480D80|nr:hypothetical protein [Streptomyces roseoverticillatus]MCF3105592.1 hypothetical protein [Streptomyces roseoverticillatus]
MSETGRTVRVGQVSRKAKGRGPAAFPPRTGGLRFRTARSARAQRGCTRRRTHGRGVRQRRQARRPGFRRPRQRCRHRRAEHRPGHRHPAPGTRQRAYVLDRAGQGDQVARRGLARGDKSSALFAVTTNAERSGYWLHILPDPKPLYEARFAGQLGTGPDRPVVGGRLKLGGRLELDGPSPAEPVKVTAVREDTDGTFHVLDTPWAAGSTTYTVTWNGGDPHEASSASATVKVGLRD